MTKLKKLAAACSLACAGVAALTRAAATIVQAAEIFFSFMRGLRGYGRKGNVTRAQTPSVSCN